METLTFRELSQIVAEKHNMPRKEVQRILVTLNDAIVTQTKKGNKIRLTGIGSFYKIKRKSRKGRNPQTGAEIMTKARWVPKFRASKQFKETIA